MPDAAARIADVSVCLYYDDAAAAIDWLCAAFGLRRRLVVHGAGGAIVHSELTFGDSVVMVSSATKRPGHLGQRRLPAASHGLSVFVADADAHYATARAAGARILTEIADAEHGGRGYEAEDIEGHRWYFGSYRVGSYWNADGTPAVTRH